ncbi:uncharacterized protein LOC120199302 [Hibiscus syriacus]|nr:uncharacterized protein LOC120199302 [Hibiscus syriacus]
MEELGSMCNYQEDFDQLKFSLQFTTIELESLKIKVNEEKRKHSEEIKHLLRLLKLAYKERDEAREELQLLMSELVPHPHSEIPIVVATKANSGITDTSSLSDAYNHHHPHVCSCPGDSFFDTVTSPDLSTTKIASDSCMSIDSEAAAIDDIAKGRTLP